MGVLLLALQGGDVMEGYNLTTIMQGSQGTLAELYSKSDALFL